MGNNSFNGALNRYYFSKPYLGLRLDYKPEFSSMYMGRTIGNQRYEIRTALVYGLSLLVGFTYFHRKYGALDWRGRRSGHNEFNSNFHWRYYQIYRSYIYGTNLLNSTLFMFGD